MSAAREVESAKENALRQLGHLSRVISYGYPPTVIRAHRRAADTAVSSYTAAMDARSRELRTGARASR